MPDIFLSYSREDQPTARRYAEALQREGFSVWWDQALRSGEDYDQVTEDALQQARAVVVLWSKTSIASRWVRAEATLADRNGTLMPVMIEDCRRPIMFELKHSADLSRWKGDAGDPAWQGYVADVRRLVQREVPPESGATAGAGPVAAAPKIEVSLRSRSVLIAAAVVLLGAGSMALWLLRGHDAVPSATVAQLTAESTARIRADATAVVPASVAVMPFANLTGEAGKDYFGDGMAEELLDALAQIKGLRVASRTSSFAYRGRDADIKQIARELGVATIIEGSVRSAGDRIRITAQLISAESGYHLWSQTYDRDFKDLFKLQDDLAREIVTAFSQTMGADFPGFVSRRPATANLEAYMAYMQAFHAWQTPGGENPMPLAKRAVELDPNFARAHWMLAAVESDGGALAEAELHAKRARELDPDLAWDVLGNIQSRRGHWIEAEETFRSAPKDFTEADNRAANALSTLWPTGQLRNALRELGRAHELYPHVIPISSALGALQLTLGNDAEAMRALKRLAELGVGPDANSFRALRYGIAMHAGQLDEAAAMAVEQLPEHLRKEGGADTIRLIHAAIARPEKRQAAVDALGQLLARTRPDDRRPRISAQSWYTQLGAIDAAYRVAAEYERQYAGKYPLLSWSWLWTGEMRPFRQDPRFHDLMAKVGMLDFWKKYGPPDECELVAGRLSCH